MNAYAELARQLSGRDPSSRKSVHTATVVRRDQSGTLWVAIPGGADETPIYETVCDVQPGDIAKVEIENGKARITGSTSSPSISRQTADEMLYPVSLAAHRAEESATTAQTMADSATRSATQAATSAAAAATAASEAVSSAATAYEAAQTASAKADAATASAAEAATQASNALSSALIANAHAIGASMGLSEVERVVGTLNWISQHGSYVPTTEQAVNPAKVYYTRTGSGTTADPYVYAMAEEPSDDHIADYYELVVDESVQNYIASHLSQTAYGLDLLVDGTTFRMHIGNVDGSHAMGTYIVDEQGNVSGKFASDGAQVGAMTGVHVEIKGTRMSFLAAGYSLPDDMTGIDPTEALPGEVAFIAVDPETGQSTFYMNRSVVVNDLRFGKWQWKSRANGNMALKWIG